MFNYPSSAGVAGIGSSAQYQNAVSAINQGIAAAPRELRILERLEGMSGSIQELEAFLSVFSSRLTGQILPTSNAERPPSAGIFDSIGRVEEGLRNCRELVRKLDDTF